MSEWKRRWTIGVRLAGSFSRFSICCPISIRASNATEVKNRGLISHFCDHWRIQSGVDEMFQWILWAPPPDQTSDILLHRRYVMVSLSIGVRQQVYTWHDVAPLVSSCFGQFCQSRVVSSSAYMGPILLLSVHGCCANWDSTHFPGSNFSDIVAPACFSEMRGLNKIKFWKDVIGAP